MVTAITVFVLVAIVLTWIAVDAHRAKKHAH